MADNSPGRKWPRDVENERSGESEDGSAPFPKFRLKVGRAGFDQTDEGKDAEPYDSWKGLHDERRNEDDGVSAGARLAV